MNNPVLYGTGTCYNCLPEYKPSGQKHVHVADSKIKFNNVAFSWSTLCCYDY